MDKIDNIEELKELASLIRQDIVKMLSAAGSGHTGGSLGLTDIFTVLYFNILNHDPEKPIWPERDRLILSNGHIVPVRYATMARAGYFSITKLKSLRKLGSFLQGHPSLHDFPAMECSGGPLGQGISVSVGMALAAKLNKEKHHIYCTVGDGELNEGQCWEGFMMAAKNKLNNLTFIIDRNNFNNQWLLKKKYYNNNNYLIFSLKWYLVTSIRFLTNKKFDNNLNLISLIISILISLPRSMVVRFVRIIDLFFPPFFGAINTKIVRNVDDVGSSVRSNTYNISIFLQSKN